MPAAAVPRPRARGLAALAAAGLLVLTALTGTASATSAAARPRDDASPAAQVKVAVDALGPAGPTVPGDFLGLSLEKRVLASAQTDARVGNLATLLRGLGTGTLRFGGDTVESTAFLSGAPGTASASRPAWATTAVGPSDFDRLATLTAASGWRVILGVGLAHADPQRAADEVAAAVDRLGPSLMAVEVGNEPNAYATRGLRDPSYSVIDYQAEFAAYRDAIDARVPGMAVVGPSSYPPSFLNGFDPGFAVPGAFVAQHLYPLNACKGVPPTIAALTSRGTAAGEAAQVRQGLTVADAHALPLRLTETNSVICSGTRGVSDTAGAALWGVDYLAQTARLGVAGVNLHGGLQQCGQDDGTSTSPWYTPLCAPGPAALAANSFTARAPYYGLALVSQLVGTSFVRAAYDTAQNVTVRATRDGAGTVRVVIDDMDGPGTADSEVRLALPAGYDDGTVQRLLAPSADATDGLTLGGAAVGLDGSLAPGDGDPVQGSGGVTTVRVSPGSAAVVTLVPHCTVPSLRGLTLQAARERLVSHGCRSGIISAPRGTAPGATLVVRWQRLPVGAQYRLFQPVHLGVMARPAKKKAKKPPTRRR